MKKILVDKFADITGYSTNTIYRHIREGLLKSEKQRHGGRDLLYIVISDSDLERHKKIK